MKTKKCKNLIEAVAFVVCVLVAGLNVCFSQRDLQLSDLEMANVEALANPETPDDFTKYTCCIAVVENYTCHGCNGKVYSYAMRQ